MDCKVAIVWMHDYLDGELPRDDMLQLKTHLFSCPACRARFGQLESAEALAARWMNAAPEDGADRSADLKARIMGAIPARRSRPSWTGWIRNHPAVTVAAVFAFVMLSSFVAMWEQNSELTVRGTDLAQLQFDGDTVTVPATAHVRGNLTIENGKANVLGEVDGNVTVIEGTLYQASTAHITGKVKKIDQALDWFWYKVSHSISNLAY